jgi:hypothetical protein
MNQADDRPAPQPSGGFFRSRTGIALLVLLAIAGYFLWTEHQAHVISALPWILLAACPLLHVFMHRGGHGGHHGSGQDGGDR